MTTFFTPGVTEDSHFVEDTHRELRRQVELDMGRRPNGRRILRRREGLCEVLDFSAQSVLEFDS